MSLYRRHNEYLRVFILSTVFFFVAISLYLMFVMSFKDAGQIAQNLWAPWPPYHPENYATSWKYVYPYLGNTLFVGIVTVLLTLFFGSISAYVFARHRFPGREILFMAIILLMMVPGILNLIPLFVICKSLHLLNTLWGVILPSVAGGQVTTIYILRTFFEEQPEDLFDSAKIDGASDFQIYRHIALPLAQPILATLAVMTFVGQWNNYIWPLVILKDDALYTVTIGLAHLESQMNFPYGELMAGYTLASVPLVLLFLFTMRLFIRGLASGAIKA